MAQLSAYLSLAIQQFLFCAPGILGLIAALGLLLLAGAAVSNTRMPVLLVACGWAVAVVASMLLALVGLKSLTVMFVLLLLLAAWGAWRLRRRPLDTRLLLHCVALGLPLLGLSAIVPSTFWDSYLHWLPNAAYLVQANELIAAPLPQGFYSMHATYAPALAMPVYLASLLTGKFAIGAAQALTSALLILATQYVAVEIASRPQASLTASGRWLTALMSFLALALLNPTIHSFSSWPPVESLPYWSVLADSTVAALILVTFVVVVRTLTPEDSAGPKPHDGSAGAAVLLSLGALLATLKPNGVVLTVVVVLAIGIVAAAARQNLRRTGLVVLLPIIVGAAAVSALWHMYQLRFLPVGDQFSFSGTGWRFDLLPEFLRACWGIVWSNKLFYLCVILAVALGARALLSRERRPLQSLDLLLAISGLAMLGHLASLIPAYLVSGFRDWEIQSAISWQRYASQAGLASCAAVLLALGMLLRARLPVSQGPRAAAVLLLAAALAYGPMMLSAKGNMLLYMRQHEEPRRLSSRILRDELPAGSRVAAIGGQWPTIYLRYLAWAEMDAPSRPRVIDAFQVDQIQYIEPGKARFDEWLRDPDVDCIVLVDAVDFAPEVGLPAEPDQIWCRTDPVWRTLSLGRRDLHRLTK